METISRITIIDLSVTYSKHTKTLIVNNKGQFTTEIVEPTQVHGRVNSILLDNFLLTDISGKVVSDHGISAQINFPTHPNHG